MTVGQPEKSCGHSVQRNRKGGRLRVKALNTL